jgi:hypothetical protein
MREVICTQDTCNESACETSGGQPLGERSTQRIISVPIEEKELESEWRFSMRETHMRATRMSSGAAELNFLICGLVSMLIWAICLPDPATADGVQVWPCGWEDLDATGSKVPPL